MNWDQVPEHAVALMWVSGAIVVACAAICTCAFLICGLVCWIRTKVEETPQQRFNRIAKDAAYRNQLAADRAQEVRQMDERLRGTP
jgi:hypothetical protein